MKSIVHALRFALLAALAAAACAMPVVASAAATRAAPRGPVTLEQCSWDRPGADPFMGDVVAAVDRYPDIAPDVRKRIQARMVKRAYDDVVVIKQGSITGKSRYGSTIRDMHFGADRLCHAVSRARWSETAQERGLVYCDSGQCILVPTVCRNVSRITRAEVADEHIVALPAELAPELPVALAAVPPMASPASPALAAPSAPAFEDESGGAPTFASAAGLGGGGFVGGGGVGGGGVSGGGVGGGGSPGGIGTTPAGPPTGAPITPVPEPETWLMFAAGLAATTAWARRRQRR